MNMKQEIQQAYDHASRIRQIRERMEAELAALPPIDDFSDPEKYFQGDLEIDEGYGFTSYKEDHSTIL